MRNDHGLAGRRSALPIDRATDVATDAEQRPGEEGAGLRQFRVGERLLAGMCEGLRLERLARTARCRRQIVAFVNEKLLNVDRVRHATSPRRVCRGAAATAAFVP